jgi:hypothetical protein
MNILLDYFFKITSIVPTPAASTAFLNQVCVVVLPKDGGVATGVITECTTNAEVALLTNNTDSEQLFTAGMSRVNILPMDDLDLADALEGHESDFYTILISSDFDDADVEADNAEGTITITAYANLISGTPDTVTVGATVFTAQSAVVVEGAATFRAATSNNDTAISLAAQINAHATAGALVTAVADTGVVTITANDAGSAGNLIALNYTDNDVNVGATKSGVFLTGGDGLLVGAFEGVIGLGSDDEDFLEEQAAIANRCAFYHDADNACLNMFYSFGKLLSGSNWRNQQYITLPAVDDVSTLGVAEALFDAKISFGIDDDEFGSRLALFACGGKAIVAPYVEKNIKIDMQSAALSYVSGNQPAYTEVHAALIEEELQQVIDGYIEDKEIEAGVASVTLEEANFVASADINISEPNALWRIDGEMRQTL